MYTCIVQVPYTRMYVCTYPCTYMYIHTYAPTFSLTYVHTVKCVEIACYNSFTFTIFTLRSCQHYPMYSVQVNAQAVGR